jgi:hypothetical protein
MFWAESPASNLRLEERPSKSVGIYLPDYMVSHPIMHTAVGMAGPHAFRHHSSYSAVTKLGTLYTFRVKHSSSFAIHKLKKKNVSQHKF